MGQGGGDFVRVNEVAVSRGGVVLSPAFRRRYFCVGVWPLRVCFFVFDYSASGSI
jgi:hypothetical protein